MEIHSLNAFVHIVAFINFLDLITVKMKDEF